ncbi:alpha-amylase family glycosyl hydrolase [Sphaerochaeta sp. PS]|uniref:alpha-amylase family glycosyl hydrolase n=1 Tax=Sphaerochaeta sp. PS TaxID=3076336 RepID=UPI0028A352B6|nr:alpha-amylase family glycosyl hydrolase [Sphaerochaeta sp. PS]MDT4763389.1 alpha-amylase family glycosyl hydrolase [Sphaerochaeta sp. PS]
MDLAWWQNCIVYQIYPRSFQDSNDDGVGDLKGLVRRLDYIKALGVHAIWLSPIFASPMADFGYDVSDYRAIDPIFGSLEDARALISSAHELSLKVIFDLVLNHTSNSHPWFLDSRKSRTSEKADYYIWKDSIPNNWKGAFGGKGWTYDKERGQYYFHSFLPEQPDLNWRNPATVDAIFGEVSFWLKEGVDGFRLDVINSIIKDDSFRDNPRIFGSRPRPYDMQRHIFDRNRPETHGKLSLLRRLVDTYPDRMLVGEIMVENPGEPELAASYLGSRSEELNLTFDFSLINTTFSAQKWQRSAKRWYEAVGKHRTPTWVLNNHDVNRSITRFGGNEKKARLATLFLLTQRGTVFLYYGEELGLPDSSIYRKDLRDPLGKRYWPFYRGRDPQRGPMVWTVGETHGFSEVEPWLPFSKGANRYAVENQEMEGDSMLTFYKSLIQFRNTEPVLLSGICEFHPSDNPNLMVYTRTSEEGKLLVVLNFSAKEQAVSLMEFGVHANTAQPVFTTSSESVQQKFSLGNLVLSGHEGVLFRL